LIKIHAKEDKALQYWKSTGKLTQQPMDMDVIRHTSRNSPLWKRRWLSKWFSGICGVGRWLLRWEEQPHSKCPRCLTNDETVDHVICCQHADAALLWDSGIEELTEWMNSNHSVAI